MQFPANSFYIWDKISDDPNDPVRIFAKKNLGEFDEIQVDGFRLFIKKGFEEEQIEKIKLLKKMQEKFNENKSSRST